ncbi:amino acid ABC transporter permease [Taylorella equigenitalis]|uniref:Glutamate Aspartate transport system permease protein GltJ n=3 Tax=Taylorella equigenitalis TaxID=29575 RepID=A0A654KIK4_TAYEM|nr:ABC transporter permease subunit [Taylorella equigenitalis]ADU91726.1 Glutamate Aspartate transport system permease protein GltJ [Taylorella equigenitalis MCE9]AFN35294.1 putative amino acid ABC transporter permease protein [Taylorella equigenitalis ATCC 35865]ASY29958.1 amino acid ABC transporter permease [Taylorella equigenitalis]ASY37261.1 amino acid ABC transporter permease [Taylorella equigenitalis]ASY38727.1 amino acid ABC transporter permease [Taylorella equigenitalis]
MRKFRFSWDDERFRAIVYQILVLALVVAGIWFLISNLLDNLHSRNIQTGFAFIDKEAGFAISESLIEYKLTDTYLRALAVGFLNTLFVSFLGIIGCTILGTLVGIGRLSHNWLVSKLSLVYVEVMRNIPLLIHLFFWYSLLTEILPGPRQALNPVEGVYLSNRGIMFPKLEGDGVIYIWIALVAALVLSILNSYRCKLKHAKSGKCSPVFWTNTLMIIGLPILVGLIFNSQIGLSVPELKGFNFRGGSLFTPEMSALLIGLVLYTSAFVAEIVRSGIQSVGKGQWEAGESLGLSKMRTLQLVVMPQAIRVMIPSMSNTYMNLMKNSSLAVAIGYPDIVSISNTMLTQTGQAIEAIFVIMMAYLTVSLCIAQFMAWLNRRMVIVER